MLFRLPWVELKRIKSGIKETRQTKYCLLTWRNIIQNNLEGETRIKLNLRAKRGEERRIFTHSFISLVRVNNLLANNNQTSSYHILLMADISRCRLSPQNSGSYCEVFVFWMPMGGRAARGGGEFNKRLSQMNFWTRYSSFFSKWKFERCSENFILTQSLID